MKSKTKVPHPGVFIKEELEERGWSQRDLAYMLGCSERAVTIIINGKCSITPEIAKALAMAFDVSLEFFTNLQQAYDLARAEEPDQGIAIRQRFQSHYRTELKTKRKVLKGLPVDFIDTDYMYEEIEECLKKLNKKAGIEISLVWDDRKKENVAMQWRINDETK